MAYPSVPVQQSACHGMTGMPYDTNVAPNNSGCYVQNYDALACYPAYSNPSMVVEGPIHDQVASIGCGVSYGCTGPDSRPYSSFNYATAVNPDIPTRTGYVVTPNAEQRSDTLHVNPPTQDRSPSGHACVVERGEGVIHASARQHPNQGSLQYGALFASRRSSLQLGHTPHFPAYNDPPSPPVSDYSDSNISSGSVDSSAGWIRMAVSSSCSIPGQSQQMENSYYSPLRDSRSPDSKASPRQNKKLDMGKLFACPYVNPFTKQTDCPETFTRASDARRHVATAHAQIEQGWVAAGVLSPNRALALQRSTRVTCERCSKSFSRLDALFRHMEGVGKNGRYCNPGRQDNWQNTTV